MAQEGGTGAVPGGPGETSLLGQPVPPSVPSKAAPRRGEVPYSIEAEQHLIGCMFVDEWECWAEEVEKVVTAGDFFLPEHQAIWRAFRWLFDLGWPINVPTVAYALEQLGLIDKVDEWVGPPYTEPYLVSVACHSWTAIGSEAVARIVKDYSERREMLKQAQKLAQAAHQPRETWKDLPEYRDGA